LALVSTLVLSLFIVGVYNEEQEHISDDLTRSIQSVEGYYHAALEERAHKLGSALDAIAFNSKIRSALTFRDRKKLFLLADPLFKKLRTKHNVTHFYFHDPKRINILRVHQPARHSDIINRFTALGAEKTRDFYYGIELGPLGTFTLRAVLPIWELGKLLGYIELGEEIDLIIQDMQRIFKVNLWVVIDKQYLHESDWLSGMQILGRKADWNYLPNKVIVSQTSNALPGGLSNILSQHKNGLFSENIKLEDDSKYYRGRILPLLDAGQRKVGGIVLVRDMTQRIQSTWETIVIISSSSLLIGIVLFIFFYFILARAERQLRTFMHELQGSHEHLSNAQHIAHMGSWESDMKSPEYSWSDEIYTLFEINPTDSVITYEKIIALVHPDDRGLVEKNFTNYLEQSEPYEIVYRVLMSDGRVKYISESCELTYDKTGKPKHATGIIHDITELRQADMLSERMGRIFEHSWNEIYSFNADTLNFVDVSQGARQNLGYTLDELQQLTPVDIKPEVNRDQFNALIEPLRRGDVTQVDFETIHQRKDGSNYPAEVRLQISMEESPPIFTAIIQDISERKQYIEELEHKALYDTLTDLPNRSLLHDRLEHALKVARRESSTLAVFIVNIVRLREINDVMGYQNGDIVIKKVSHRLVKGLRDADTVALLRGDEFTIVLSGINQENINFAIDKIQKLFKEPIIIEDIPIEIESVIGIALYPLHGEDPDMLIRHADIAMHVAKNGVNGFNIYNPDDDPYSLPHLKLYGELREAINNKTLALYYQPKIDIKTGKIKSVEALARWPHPERGMISPVEFIPMIEQTGMIRPFTLWILEQAIIQIKHWTESGIDLSIAVNLSTRNLLDPSLPDYIENLLDTHQVSANNISLEITESAIMSRPESAIALLERLHDMGFKISIDDFGTGYSSLAYIKKLPVHELKIDQSFIFGLITNKDDEIIVRSTIDLAHNLGLSVVAEGIESKEILDMLMILGCDIGQGYYFSRPIPSDELSCWLYKSSWGLS